jgi:anti-sigma-K factor RskA
MSDIHALSGAYATDALDDDERARFEQHLDECADCRAEVATFHETAALLAETEAEAPPPGLRGRVLGDISQVRPLPPVTPLAEVAEPTPVVAVRRRWVPRLVAAAVAVILLAGGILAWHPWRSEQESLADQVLHASDAVRVTETLANGAGTLTLVTSPSLGRAVMVGDHVPQPPAGKTYQLWLQQPGRAFVPAGLMPDATKPTLLTGDAATATQAAVSVEPEAGSPHPTSAPVAVFPLSSSG